MKQMLEEHEYDSDALFDDVLSTDNNSNISNMINSKTNFQGIYEYTYDQKCMSILFGLSQTN